MDEEVAQTLASLERKLADLERELSSIGGRQADGGDAGPAAPFTAPPGASRPRPDLPTPPTMLVDEAVEQRFSMEARETVYGEIPATKDARETIDLAELIRFKQTMQQTLQNLIDEYSRLLSLKPPTDA